MSALLDLDDVVADNPLAKTELSELRADLVKAKAELAESKGALGHCLQSLMGWQTLYPDDWDIVDKIAMEEINKSLAAHPQPPSDQETV